MRVVFSGGGTAGHINPALAIADTIQRAEPKAEIRFFGGKKGLEADLVSAAGYPITLFEIEGIKRSLSPANARAVLHAIRAYRVAKKELIVWRPDIVIGTGGYVCWPTLRAAASLGIPTALHESNAVLGMAAKSLVKRVDLLLVNHEETLTTCTQAKRALCVGNPLRIAPQVFGKTQAKRALFGNPHARVLLSFGGSLGAEAINALALDLLCENLRDIVYVHITGKRSYDVFCEACTERGILLGNNRQVFPYLYNLQTYLIAADLVICRAGAMTLSELAIFGTPSILIPSPNVTGNHQYHNAIAQEKAGAACVFTEDTLKNEEVLSHIFELLFDRTRLQKMSSCAKKIAHPQANTEILRAIRELISKKS